VQVLFFGKIGEMLGRSVQIDGAPASVAELRHHLAEQYPHASAELLRPSLRACVGDELVQDSFPLNGVGTVEFFPPLSGG
jgi:molybdopterin converting factor small subunit